METSVKAGEARLYWCAVSNIRSVGRAKSNNQTNEHRDDLEVLIIHSNWPRLKAAAAATLADAAGGEAVATFAR